MECQECGIGIVEGKGIVCGNFGFTRRHWTPCQGAWHADCYAQHHGDVYPVHSLEADEDGLFYDEDVAEEKKHYKTARDGDHLMCPFQCDLCHFRNIQERNPGSDPRDEVLLMAIRRASLDSFWARESTGAVQRQGSERLWDPKPPKDSFSQAFPGER